VRIISPSSMVSFSLVIFCLQTVTDKSKTLGQQSHICQQCNHQPIIHGQLLARHLLPACQVSKQTFDVLYQVAFVSNAIISSSSMVSFSLVIFLPEGSHK
jgi:hypothetical protein